VSKKHPSLLRVLGWRLTVASAVFLALILLTLQSRVETAAQSLFNHALEEEAESIVARLTDEPNGEIGFLPLGSGEEASSIILYRVIDKDGRILFESTGLPPGLPPNAGMPRNFQFDGGGDHVKGPMNFFSLGPPDLHHNWNGATLITQINGMRVFVQVFEDLDERGVLLDDLVREFFFQVGWLSIPFVGLLLIVNLVSIWTGLRPLTRVSRMAAEIGPETIGRRLPEEGQPRELVPLIRSVNRALERLDRGFQMQRQFTADAAHELRTPLAVLSAHLDTLGDGKALVALRQELAVMSRLVGQLLRIAQLDSLSLGGLETIDLHQIAVDAASALAPLALKNGKWIAVGGVERPVWVRGDTEALSQAIRNLIENALAHSPKGTTVEIQVDADRTVRVIDSGPGVAPDNRALIFQRFWRADRRSGGAGLGLAIVAKVAETHGGTINVEDAPMGGAVFVLRLPSPDEAITIDRHQSNSAIGHDTAHRSMEIHN
jgi:signal transduction histidine kinase